MLAKRIIPCLDVKGGRVGLVEDGGILCPVIVGKALYGGRFMVVGLPGPVGIS